MCAVNFFNNNVLLTAQPSKIEFLREKFEKSRDFAREKTKLDAGSEANSAASFVFSRAKSRHFETFRVRTRFYEDGPAITVVITSWPVFSRKRTLNEQSERVDARCGGPLSRHSFGLV